MAKLYYDKDCNPKNLKDKKKIEFIAEIERKEQIELDEIAIRQYTNKLTNV